MCPISVQDMRKWLAPFFQVKCMCIGHILFSRCFLQAECLDLMHGRGLRMVQEKGHVHCAARGGLGGCLGEGLDFQIFQLSLLCHMPSARAEGPAFPFPVSLCLLPLPGEWLGNQYIDTHTQILIKWRTKYLHFSGSQMYILDSFWIWGNPALDVSFACRSSPTCRSLSIRAALIAGYNVMLLACSRCFY